MSYESVSGGALKLKKSHGKIKKKKKSKVSKHKIELSTSQSDSGEESGGESETKPSEYHGQTKAEIMFQRAQVKKQEKELLKIASSTHKDRIMKFNDNLDKLSEHFDIPKVSWTK